MPTAWCDLYREHINTINGTRFYTQVTTGTFINDDGVHLFGSTKNSVNRAGLNALRTANAFIFADVRYGANGFTSKSNKSARAFIVASPPGGQRLMASPLAIASA
jgi:hypothetical protein